MSHRPSSSRAEQATLEKLDTTGTALEALRADVETSEDLAALGLLSSFIAHECRSRLAPILSYARAAAARPDDSELTRTALERIAASAAQLSELTELILLAKAPKEGESSYLQTIWDDVMVDRLERCHRGSIEVKVDIEGNPRVAMTQAALHHLLRNLVDNAVAAMPGGGRLELRTRSTRNIIRIALDDSGWGMDHSGDKPKGHGLGLALCEHLLRITGGAMRFEASPLGGTRVALSLPRAS